MQPSLGSAPAYASTFLSQTYASTPLAGFLDVAMPPFCESVSLLMDDSVDIVQAKLNSLPGIQGVRVSLPGIQGVRVSLPGIQGVRVSLPGILGVRVSLLGIQGVRVSLPGILGVRVSLLGIQGVRMGGGGGVGGGRKADSCWMLQPDPPQCCP